MKIGNMERTLTQQLSRKIVRPLSASYQQGQETRSYTSVTSGARIGCVLCSGRKHGIQKLGLSVRNISSIRTPNSRSNNNDFVNTKRKQKRATACCVVGEGGRSSSPASDVTSSEDDLKDQLEAFHEEALRVRDRYNSARARFMRLTEVAQQLRQRATIDLNLGNEDGARKVLVEKQKVIRAAEFSKKRAQLLEELCTKLGEAISAKETQLIVSLSRPQQNVSSDVEPTVRVISPKEEQLISFDLDLDTEENLTSTLAGEVPQVIHELTSSEGTDRGRALLTGTDDTEGYDGKQVLEDNGAVLIEEVDTAGLENGDSAAIDNEVGVLCQDTSVDKMDLSGLKEAVGNSREVSVNDGGSLLFEDYMLNMDLEVAAIESKLRTFMVTAVNSNNDPVDEKLKLVGELLEQIEGLRSRISAAVRSLPQMETQ